MCVWRFFFSAVDRLGRGCIYNVPESKGEDNDTRRTMTFHYDIRPNAYVRCPARGWQETKAATGIITFLTFRLFITLGPAQIDTGYIVRRLRTARYLLKPSFRPLLHFGSFTKWCGNLVNFGRNTVFFCTLPTLPCSNVTSN